MSLGKLQDLLFTVKKYLSLLRMPLKCLKEVVLVLFGPIWLYFEPDCAEAA